MGSDELFNVILIGIDPEKNENNVKAAVARIYQVEQQHIQHLFTGAQKILKRSQSLDKAKKIAKTLSEAGLIIEIQPIVERNNLHNVTEQPSPPEVKPQGLIVLPPIKIYFSIIMAFVIGVTLGALLFNNFRTTIYGLTNEEKELVSKLKINLKATEQELKDAIAENQRYEKSLVKSLIELRIGILHNTADLIRLRIYSIEAGDRPNISTNLSSIDDVKAKQIEDDIQRQMAVVEESQSEVGQYGGLVGAMRASRLATEQQTLAMLRWRYYLVKYGSPIITSLQQVEQQLSNSLTDNETTVDSLKSGQEATKIANKPAVDINVCKSLADAAKMIMTRRQEEIPMHTLLEISRDNQSSEVAKALELIVSMAYSESAMLTDKNKVRQQDEFSNKVFKQCYDAK